MSWFKNLFGTEQEPAAPPPSVPLPAPSVAPPPSVNALGGVSLIKKGQTVSLTKHTGGVYTLVTQWGEKDYDLYALVEYADGHVEVVSCFGTINRPRDFSLRTKDGAIVHVSGDKTAYGLDLPQEVMTVRLNPNIRCVVPVVYSARNSGTGSFYRYKVSTFVLPGVASTVPNRPVDGSVQVLAENASRNDLVYTFVPCVIHNDPSGPRLEVVEKYSEERSERRPTVHDGVVAMDNGEENGTKR